MSAPRPWVLQPDGEGSVAELGGKGMGLRRLTRLGLPVPPFLVLSAAAFRSCCPEGNVPSFEEPRLKEALDAVWSSLSDQAGALAVRSSAVAEDAEAHSWAGQMGTFLNVTSRADLGEKVLACWRSLYSDRATLYRDLAGADGGPDSTDEAMAVVIQVMVEPDASGVLFTMDPVSGRRDRVIVSAVLGVGEGLVSGTLDADTFVADRQGRILERTLVAKSERMTLHPHGGLHVSEVDAAEAHRPALSDTEIQELVVRSLAAEEAAGMPLDIEFAVAGGALHFLQARPVTTADAKVVDTARQLWDNSNIGESYPGITLPLTFSFIRRAYHAVYWQFCEILGMSTGEIRSNDHMLWNMLGLHRGTVYYNLRNWYRLVSVLPGFRQNRRFMEGMMGVTQEGGDPGSDRVSRSKGALALASTALRAAWLQATLERRIRTFHRTFDEVHGAFAAKPYETMPATEIMEEYRRVEQALLWEWKAPIVNDFSVMIFYGLLKHLTVRWGVDPQGNLQNALVAKQGGIESTEVSDALERLADTVGADPELAQRVLDLPVDDVFDAVATHPACGPELQRYMDRFGDRCVAELKLESSTMHDDPRPLMEALRSSLRRKAQNGAAVQPPDLGEEARAAVRSALSWWQRPLYAWVLRGARRGIRARENQRLARTRAFALVRRMTRCVGDRFVEAGLLEHRDDVFYLELDELMRSCDGTGTLSGFGPLVEARRAEFDAFAKGPPPPDRFTTIGIAVISEHIADRPDADPDGTPGLRGLAAYPGIVERRAVVMPDLDPSTPLDGAILVTRQTDPGWVILFPGISGLVVERGSMLSHSAIVAREMGIPAVVGVRGAMATIRTGDILRLDGGAGTVQVVDRADGAREP